jgi:topoisomerase IA-like protein
MATYGKKAEEKVEKAMHERKRGTLKSGGSGKTVTSRKQAIAIGLSEARAAGGKVPAKKTTAKKSPARKTTARKSR